MQYSFSLLSFPEILFDKLLTEGLTEGAKLTFLLGEKKNLGVEEETSEALINNASAIALFPSLVSPSSAAITVFQRI